MKSLIAPLIVVVAISSLCAGDVQQDSFSCAPSVTAAESVPSSVAKSTTRPAIVHPETVQDIRVELALFGSGTHLADVTDRVAELLRDKPEGFTARAEWFHIDPAPGKNKSLLIRYRCRNQERFFLVTGGNRASYAALAAEEDVGK
ncbi:MAG TPA: hypothetical protein VFW44_11055 [Bryobacteraceae bacterium]|nr:hypothetical protein [Bryobacteraceae bacterium]